MTYSIKKSILRDEIRDRIKQGFYEASLAAVGHDGLSEPPLSFEIYDKDKWLGAIVVQMFWGQLHIKYLYIEEAYRKQGIGQKLMEHAFEYGKTRGCTFAFIETMNFQALDFYIKQGFKLELQRKGYDQGVSFNYLRKDL